MFFVKGNDDGSSAMARDAGHGGVAINNSSTLEHLPVKGGTLDALLTTSYCRNQMYLSQQLAQLHPELTMPMFSGECIMLLLLGEACLS